MLNDRQVIAFLESVSKAAQKIREVAEKGDVIHIFSHLDADGIAAAGILGKALYRLEARFRIRITQWIDDKIVDEVAQERPKMVVFMDLGSDYANLLKQKIPETEVIVLDHHQIISGNIKEFLCINPRVYGIDGTRDVSSSGVAYFAAKAINAENVDLAPIAVVGALGDLQDKYDQRALGGLNGIIVEDAKTQGLLAVEKDLMFFGRETRPIHRALASTTNPFIPGISGSEGGSFAFLESLGIRVKIDDRWRALRDLSDEEKRKLCTALADYLLSKGLRYEISNLVGHVYTLTQEDPWTPLRDAREFAVLLNATGRMDKPGLGVAVCMGDRGTNLEEANKILEEYRRTVNRYLEWIAEKPGRIRELENIYVIYGEDYIDDKIVSTISSIIYTSLPNFEKPLIVYADVKGEGVVKVSARTVDAVASKGVNLGEIMQAAAEKCLGKGGGHDVAAGAQIPIENVEIFIKLVNEFVGKKLAYGKF
jgi:RecJ-like exonuclease